jgi:hypothetical protein
MPPRQELPLIAHFIRDAPFREQPATLRNHQRALNADLADDYANSANQSALLRTPSAETAGCGSYNKEDFLQLRKSTICSARRALQIAELLERQAFIDVHRIDRREDQSA